MLFFHFGLILHPNFDCYSYWMKKTMVTQQIKQTSWQDSQQKMTSQAVSLCHSESANNLNQVIKRISMKDSLRTGESLVYFS